MKVTSSNLGSMKVGLTEPCCTLSTLRVDTHCYDLCHCSICVHFNKGFFTFAQTKNLKKGQELREEYNELWFSSLIVFHIVNPEISKEIHIEQYFKIL
jgi:hypothetical protein